MEQERKWIFLSRKAKDLAKWSKDGLNREQISAASKKIMDEFRATAADPTKGKEMIAMMSKSFDDILPKG